VIRDFDPADTDQTTAVLALNAANVPEVGPMDANKLAFFASTSPYFKIVEGSAGEIIGMLIGLTQNEVAYQSPNFKWFCERNERFAYVDRIAIAENGRGQGWGPALYTDFASWARAQKLPMMCAEVNTIPPNPRSAHFHEVFGFEEAARTNPYGPNEEVAMLELTL